jgi:hypothetical protein
MKQILLCWVVLGCRAWAQDAAWDDSPHAAELAAHAARLKPVLEELNPQAWIAQGAPETYRTQLEGIRLELERLSVSARALDSQPQKLTAALDTYFRLQSLEWRIESLVEAVRKYQSPALGDLLLSVLRSNSGNRDGLREYILDLAQRKEQEFSVAYAEAQRCQTERVQMPTAAPRRAPAKP